MAARELRLALLLAWWNLVDWWEARPAWLLFGLYLAAIAVACALVTGCATRTVYVDRPGPERIVERKVYVAIPAALTAPLAIATGPLPQCPVVARDRRTQLELGNARFEAIAKIQGQPAEALPAP